jgi:uncharacterized delta-60 repeat protein
LESERAMARQTLGLTGGLLAVVLGTTLVVGCGDDGGDDSGDGGDGGSAGSRAGSGGGGAKAGSAGSGGSSTAGTDAGESGNGGTSVDPVGGNGGTGIDPVGGEGGIGGTGIDPVGGEGGTGGAPDPDFNPKKVNGPNGTLITQVNELRGLTFSSSGKIYASGHVGAFTGYPGGVDRQIAVLRFNADGTFDTSWDGDGIKVLPNLRTRDAKDEDIKNDGDEYSLGVVELKNGDIVVQANVRSPDGKGRDVKLVKLSSIGVGVNWTGTQSYIRQVDFGWKDADNGSFPNAPAAQPVDEAWGLSLDNSGTDQKLVITGLGSSRKLTAEEAANETQRTDNDRYVVRVLATTGGVDPTFHGGVPYTFNSSGAVSDGGRRGLVEADGSIVAAGYADAGGATTIFALRLLPDGTPDPAFEMKLGAPETQPDLDGVAIVNPFRTDGGGAECYAVAKQSTGGYITTGYGRATKDAMTASTFADGSLLPSENVDAISLRLLKGEGNATLDTTWGLQGALVFQSEDQPAEIKGNAEDRARDVTVIANDRLAYAGRFGANPAIFLATADGEADASRGGPKSGPDGADTIPGVFTFKPLTGTTSHFFRIAASDDGKRVAAVTGNHVDGVILAVVDVE